MAEERGRRNARAGKKKVPLSAGYEPFVRRKGESAVRTLKGERDARRRKPETVNREESLAWLALGHHVAILRIISLS